MILRINNCQSRPVTLVVEPWAEEKTLAPQSAAEVEFELLGVETPDTEYMPEIVVNDDSIVVFGWVGARFVGFK